LTTRRGLAIAILLGSIVLGGLVTGCASGSSGAGTGATAATTPTTRQLDEHANGSTVEVHLGDTVVVVLHSTYWTFATPSSTLQLVGQPQPSPSQCSVPGSGCGTVTAGYNARQVGTTTLHAHRDSCGEAVRCTGSDGDWTVTVRVS
jgi:hypothetical protein